MLHHESWKSIYFGVKKSRVKVTRHTKQCQRGFLHSCGCWFSSYYSCLPAVRLVYIAEKSGVTRPINIAQLAGSTVVFGCRSSKANNQTRWDFYPHGVNQPSTVFNGERIDPSFSDRFEIDVASCRRRRCDLTIRDVRPRDAGFYVCFEPSSSNRKSSALVVLRGLFYTLHLRRHRRRIQLSIA